MDLFGDLRRMNKRQLYYQVLNFAMIVSSALMIWKGLIVVTGSESPIVVVLSGALLLVHKKPVFTARPPSADQTHEVKHMFMDDSPLKKSNACQ